jgi:leucyl aminopeptidase
MQVSFSAPSLPVAGTLIVTVGQERTLGPAGQAIDQTTGGMIGRALAASRFTGKKDETLELLAPAGLSVARLLLVGLGKAEALTEAGFESAAGTAVAFLNKSGETAAWLRLELPEGVALTPARAAAAAALGAQLRAYRFDRYRTTEKPEQKPSLERLTVLVETPDAAVLAFAALEPLLEGVRLARDLVSEPPNRLTPVELAERCASLAELGVEITVLDPSRMSELGMGALLGVAQGSANPPRLVTMAWRGNPEAEDPRPLALVGKGVTFDSGGISIKPAAGMEDMKWDMAGAAAVIGAMRALAGRKARANVVGVVGLVENMPSGNAQRPGDVVVSASGKTIEVINTDAEGRLVLADAIWYAQQTFKPRQVIDLATLTGAVIIALGHEQAGLFASDDTLADQLTAAGKSVGEPLWRLPMGEAYDKDLNSDIADVKNVGSGRAAGSITGAQFVRRFVSGDVPWAHLDIAGVAWGKKDSATVPKGGTGFGVRLLDRFVAETWET